MKNYLARLFAMLLSLCAWLVSGNPTVLSQSTNPYPEISQRWGNPDVGMNESPNKIIATATGQFIIAGFWQDSAWVKKITSCGSPIWDKRFQVGTWTSLNSICELPNGNLAATGVCKNCAVGDTARKAYAVLMDASGNLLTDTTMGNLNLDAEGRDIVRLRNGNLAMTGFQVVSSVFGPCDQLVVLLNPSLNVIRYTPYHRAFYDVGNHIIATRDSGFAIAGENAYGFFLPNHGTLLKCNAQGDTSWMTVDTTLQSQFFSVAEGSNGDLIAVGKVRIDTVTIFDGYLRAINGSNGQLGTRQFYGSPGWFDELMDIHAVADGYLVGGRYDNGATSGYGARDMVFHLSPGLVQSDLTFNDDYLVNYGVRSMIPLSPFGEDWATVSRYDQFGIEDARFMKHHRYGKDFQFTAFPMDYQLYPRNSQGWAKVAIEGTDSATGLLFDSVRVRVLRNDTLISTTTHVLTYTVGAASVSDSIFIPAILSEYQFLLEGFESGALSTELDACGVVAGDAFIFTGNVGGNIPLMDSTLSQHANPWVRSYSLKYGNDTVFHWHRERDDPNPIADNRSGDVGLIMADQIVMNHHIPVAIVNGGYSAQMIDSMLPTISNGHYQRFLKQATRSGLRNHVKSLILLIGEGDTYITDPDSVPTFLAKYTVLRNAWDVDFPNRTHDFLSQMRQLDHPLSSPLSSLQIAEAQRIIPDIFPNTTVLSTTGLNHDSIYYWFTGGFDRGANDLYRLVDQKVYGAAAVSNSLPPNLDSIKYNSNRTEIILYFRNVNNTLTWFSGMESDFILEDASNVSVVIGYIAGNTAHLVLSGQAPLGARISYNSHVLGSGCSVKNANGIGMLRFYRQDVDFPVGTYLAQSDMPELKVYPNPVSGSQVHVGVSGMRPGELSLKLYSLEGKCLHVWNIPQTDAFQVHDLDLNVGNGVYLLEATDSRGNRCTTKLVKI